jgi:putative salt-induced outer membrane protein
MKLLKTVPAAVMLAGGLLRLRAQWPMIPFLLSWMTHLLQKPFEGTVNAGYLAQSGNTKSSSMTADSTLTWYGNTTAWSLWGNASNTSSNDQRSSERYAVGDVVVTT